MTDMENVRKSYENEVAEMSKGLCTRTDKKRQAQALLMDGIGTVLDDWAEGHAMVRDALGDEANVTEFEEILKREADRIAKLFGFEEAWFN